MKKRESTGFEWSDDEAFHYGRLSDGVNVINDHSAIVPMPANQRSKKRLPFARGDAHDPSSSTWLESMTASLAYEATERQLASRKARRTRRLDTEVQTDVSRLCNEHL